MKHKHFWLAFWYHEGCAPCKVRQLLFGFRRDPVGYNHARNQVRYDTRFSSYERVYILNICQPVEIDF